MGIGALPELQEVVVGHTGLGIIAFESVGAPQSEVGQRGEREVRERSRDDR